MSTGGLSGSSSNSMNLRSQCCYPDRALPQRAAGNPHTIKQQLSATRPSYSRFLLIYDMDHSLFTRLEQEEDIFRGDRATITCQDSQPTLLANSKLFANNFLAIGSSLDLGVRQNC